MAFRYAICNETFEGLDHGQACAIASACGYQGLEVAPFTLAPRIDQVDAKQLSQFRSTAEGAGIPIIGLHWLLAKTEGFQVTSPDPAVRAKTASYLGELATACHKLGGHLMVFGSPLQRKIPPGSSRDQARGWFLDTLRQTLPHLEANGVSFLLEPLSPPETDFLLTATEAISILDELNHPLLGLHLDVKAMSGESFPIPQIIKESRKYLRHFHANDANRKGPGFGSVDFRPIFQSLMDVRYPGWVSVEVFDYTPDPQTIARKSINYMLSCENALIGTC